MSDRNDEMRETDASLAEKMKDALADGDLLEILLLLNRIQKKRSLDRGEKDS